MKKFILLLVLAVCACHQPFVKYRAGAATSGSTIKPAVESLFSSYEYENAQGIEQRLASDFISNDKSASTHDRNGMERAIRDDFRNLDRPYFEATVNSATLHDGLYRIGVRWFRRAYTAQGGQEWIVRDQESALIFKKENDVWKLWRIEGDPIFGISNSSGAILLRTGTVNGAAVGASSRIENGAFVP